MRLEDALREPTISDILHEGKITPISGRSPRICTTLDHVYPRTKFGQPCYCGARTWGGKVRLVEEHPTVPVKLSSEDQQIVLDKVAEPGIQLVNQGQSASQPASTQTEPLTAHETLTSLIKKDKLVATLTLRGKSKNGKNAIYEGSVRTMQIPLANFDGEPPASFEVPMKAKAVKEVKQPLTDEEKAARKAERAARPKPTLAERAAAAAARAAKLQAQLDSAASQPSL